MAAPTSLDLSVDREEYSRFEEERNTVLATLDVSGSSLLAEEVTVELRKARRARDEVVVTKTVTLSQPQAHALQVEFSLPEIIDDQGVPKVRRGQYFLRATSVTDTNVTSNSEDFKVALISVARLKKDYLHGTDQFASDQLDVVEQPQVITGVTVEQVSLGHPKQAFPLAYSYAIPRTPQVTGTASETFNLTDGDTLVLRFDGGAPQTATFNTADFSNIAAATAAEVAAVINADIPDASASDSSGQLQIEGGKLSLVVDPTGTATGTLGLTGQGDVVTPSRTLSWCGGPVVSLQSGKRLYTLRMGGGRQDYIKVRVSSILALPFESHAEDLIIDKRPLDDERIRQLIEQTASWVEDVSIAAYLEPTRIVTELDPNTVTKVAGTTNPELQGATWDEIVDGVSYERPSAGHWLNFKCPYQPLIRFDKLYGKLANTKILDVDLNWVQHHEPTGWVELVPWNQNAAFNFLGLLWVESLRGSVPLPGFWNFEAVVGFRKTPPVLIELVAKQVSIDILTIAGQAFRGGFASQSVSRDGVSESVSYTASATFGIYSATIEQYKKWVDENLTALRGSFRGVNMVVL